MPPWDHSKGLMIRWTKRERDWLIRYPTRPDGHLASGFISGFITWEKFVDELNQRGYDTTTLRLVVLRKPKEAKENG